MHFYAASSLLAAVTDLLQRLVRPALIPVGPRLSAYTPDTIRAALVQAARPICPGTIFKPRPVGTVFSRTLHLRFEAIIPHTIPHVKRFCHTSHVTSLLGS